MIVIESFTGSGIAGRHASTSPSAILCAHEATYVPSTRIEWFAKPFGDMLTTASTAASITIGAAGFPSSPKPNSIHCGGC